LAEREMLSVGVGIVVTNYVSRWWRRKQQLVTIVRRGVTLQWKNKSSELWLRDDVTVSHGLEEMVM
jgi:hypothetical protein